jgi:hypothetical protein
MMMRSSWSKWLSGVGGVALIGGLVLSNYGGGVAPAEAKDHQKQAYNHPNPFRQIMDKLNDILAKLNGGAGGGEEGNYTMRWDINTPSASRFTVLTGFGGAAVRDNNTGLVWEQAPTTMLSWTDARFQCLNKSVPAVGGTRGWRLPSVAELTSLIDQPQGMGTPVIVPSVFTGVQLGNYWSTTSIADGGTNNKFSVSFSDGSVGSTPKGNPSYVWCVRGSMSESTY